jgi:hypothetical protein
MNVVGVKRRSAGASLVVKRRSAGASLRAALEMSTDEGKRAAEEKADREWRDEVHARVMSMMARVPVDSSDVLADCEFPRTVVSAARRGGR